MPRLVERYEPDGIDYGWIMQTTFVLTIVLGAPTVALSSAAVTLPSWNDRVRFAIAIGAVVWFCLAIAVFLYARSQTED